MIKKVKIVNFRGIKSLELDLNQISIISGKNDIGKSTALNAINWLITDKLLTDKYGEGENDIQSITPNDHSKGEHTEVSIWLDSGVVFTKMLKRSYDRNTNKINKNETEYMIGSSKIGTKKEFYETLYEQLHFNQMFSKLKVEEVRLFTDPLYALLKLDYKELRKLLVAMGCTVDNEEIYKLGFEDIRQYEAECLGKWDVKRKEIKEKLKTQKEKQTELENQLKLYNNIHEFDDSELKTLQQERDSLIIKKNDLKTKGINDLVTDLDNQKTKLTLELEEKRNNKKLEYNSKIRELELEEKNLINTFNAKKAEATSVVNTKITKESQNLYEKKSEMANLVLKQGHLQMDIKMLETEINNSNDSLSKASEELGNLLNGTFSDFVCPVCGSPIDLHADEHEFRINELQGKIQNYQSAIDRNESIISKKKIEQNELITYQNSLDAEIKMLDQEINELKFKKNSIEHSFSLDDRANEIVTEISDIRNKLLNINLEFEEENKAINELENKRNNIILESQKTINEESNEIQNKIDELGLLIKEQYEANEMWEQKVNLQKTLDEKISDVNDIERLLARFNQFIATLCHLVNNKAKEITGFDFVLLEENLTNEGITECCYVVDDKGIPFKDINTARKTIMGIEFIESCRRIAGKNNLPILADKLEGLDTDNLMKLKTITKNQIICTRVASGNLSVVDGD